MDITKKQVIKYAVLPGIFPRLKALFGTGFGSLATLIAYVFNAARILPNNHEYLRAENHGTYSIRKVLAAAANNIVFSRKNTDQIVIFFTVILGLVLFVFQFFAIIANILITQAKAQVPLPTTNSGFFVTANPQEDIAFRLLDLVFGVPGFFNSKEIANATGFHTALQDMLQFYSYGILIVSAIIIVYFIIAIVAETAQSGTPFGQRFNHAWVAARVIIFFGMLIPITSGLNGGQLVTLGVAKYGSGLATNGWLYFADSLTSYGTTLAGDEANLIATPAVEIDKVLEIPAFLFVAKTCDWSYSRYGEPIRAYVFWGNGTNDFEMLPGSPALPGTLPTPPTGVCSGGGGGGGGCTLQDYAVQSQGADLKIVFGKYDPNIYSDHQGGVEPTCGSMIVPVTDVAEPGSAIFQTAFFNMISNSWLYSTGGSHPLPVSRPGNDVGFNQPELLGSIFARTYVPVEPRLDPTIVAPVLSNTNNIIAEWRRAATCMFYGNGPGCVNPGPSLGMGGLTGPSTPVTGYIEQAVTAQQGANKYLFDAELRSYGWGGAGIWYNKIASQNGAIATAAQAIPYVHQYPKLMEEILAQKRAADENPAPEDRFTPAILHGRSSDTFARNSYMATAMNNAYLFWITSEHEGEGTGNFIFDVLNAVMGTQGLFDMCANTDIHPLAQLSAAGKSMINASVAAAGITILTTLFGMTSSAVSATTFAFSQFFGSIVSVGIMIGFILFYVIPFLPFLYFFFAVGGWIKGIFEAIVAVPLWALAHLRIDGDGMVGEPAMQGYFLLFEIFFRPILIVFGLIAAVSIFAAMVKVLHNTFHLVISNLAGVENSTAGCGTDIITNATVGSAEWMRGPVDEFFFTLIYAILVYMIGLSCFKLIDAIPNKMMRWLGAEISAFNDSSGDAAGGLLTYVSMAGSQFGSQISGGLGGIGKSLQARPAPPPRTPPPDVVS